ncbi:MAG: transposase [Shewanella sp.]
MAPPFVNREAMRQHLKQISEATHSDRYTLVIIDGAEWHTDDIAKNFDNLSFLKLPRLYSAELNPIKQVWQWLRQHCLAKRCFEGYNGIVKQYYSAWNTFIQQ